MRKILIVDDERSIRITLSEFLKAAGYQTETAESGEDALALIKENRFDLVISDIMLPGIKGDELLCEIKTDHPDMLVILITGKGTIEVATSALRHGAFDFLLKPATKEQILTAVERAIKLKESTTLNKKLLKENYLHQEHLKEVAKRKAKILSAVSRKLIEIQQAKQEIISNDINNNLGKPFNSLCKKIEKLLKTEKIAKENRKKTHSYLKNTELTLKSVTSELSIASLSAEEIIEKIHQMGKTLHEQTDTEIKISLDKKDNRLQKHININTFFLIKEAIINAIKHGNAKRITVSETDENGLTILRIHDNGQGFAKELLSQKKRKNPGLGLLLMQQRAEITNGILNIHSKINSGTEVKITFPNKK